MLFVDGEMDASQTMSYDEETPYKEVYRLRRDVEFLLQCLQALDRISDTEADGNSSKSNLKGRGRVH